MLYRKSSGKDNTIRQKNQTIIEPRHVDDLRLSGGQRPSKGEGLTDEL